MHIFDSHAHYDDRAFDSDRDELLTAMHQNGVECICNIGCSMDSIERTLALAHRYEFVYAAVGLHPEEAGQVTADDLDRLRRYAADERCVAIGEIGLDYHYGTETKEEQNALFEEQLRLAQELQLPVVIHSRDATEDTMRLVRKYRPQGVMHCFSGSAETAAELVKLGMYVGFTGVLTFSNAKKARRACEAVPIDRLLVETDCPYMAPTPLRGRRCDSSMLPYTIAAMAAVKGLSPEEMAAQTFRNACAMYRIPQKEESL